MKLIFSLLLAGATLLACGVLAQEALSAEETNAASELVDFVVLPVTRLRLARQHDPAIDSVMNVNAKIRNSGSGFTLITDLSGITPQTRHVGY